MLKNVKASFKYYKRKYAGGTMTSSTSFDKLNLLSMGGVKIQPLGVESHVGGYYYPEYRVEYENDSFEFTYQRNPRRLES